MIRKTIVLVALSLFLIVSCSDEVDFIPPDREPWPQAYYTDILIPDLAVAGGGVQSSPAAYGDVYYFNDQHQAEESDVRMGDGVRYFQAVKRYFKVSGTALPDDSGYVDRFYHSVTFSIYGPDDSKTRITLPVDTDNRFEGYLYFVTPGTNRVYAFRATDSTLYPDKSKGTQYTVDQGYSTLIFRVLVEEAVPAGLTNLLPTQQVNCGNQAIRDYALSITAGASDDRGRVSAIYDFLVDGDSAGKFTYNFYYEIFPGYLDSSWNSVFTASHFLKRRMGVCNDFAELFAALARSLKIPVMKVRGTNPSSGSGHMWNKVYFEGQWWRLDATWANGNPGSRNKYAEWSATPTQMSDFADQHENTYTDGFTETF